MKKWIEVNGKMMDSVEFTRFIREQAAPEIEELVNQVIKTSRENKMRLKRLQELA
ncbi:MAG: hypothetical protein HZB66_03285 [Candidatus Aenigmarchaeota archaeon]|nr:hypothetical protein [Candidatus Aenigmarchaeota archaeon]